MGIETKTFSIHNQTVEIKQFPGRKSLRLLLKTTSIIEGPIELAGSDSIALLDAMANKLSSINVNEMFIEIFSETTIDDVNVTPKSYDSVFVGSFPLFLELFKEVVLFNWMIYFDRQEEISSLYQKEIYMNPKSELDIDMIAKALAKEWLIWRLVTKGVELKELETYYSAADVIDANLAFEIDEAMIDSTELLRQKMRTV